MLKKQEKNSSIFNFLYIQIFGDVIKIGISLTLNFNNEVFLISGKNIQILQINRP